jgi:riboflavin kinase/FMN adenylyltransferase
MQVHRNIDQLPSFRRAVVTIGTFDGVHTGHQQLIRQLKEQAALIDGETVIITFHPHPRKIVRGAQDELRMINTLEEKIGLLAWQKVDHLVIVPFTAAFSQLTAEQYIRDFLLAKFHCHTIIIGYDHQFGKGREGNYRLLEELSKKEGFGLQEIPAHVCNTISVSSTRIREAIAAGDIATANELLGYDYFFSGVVMEGNRLGRTIGYPTANLRIENPEKLLPGDGVYAVEAELTDTVIADPQTGEPGNPEGRAPGESIQANPDPQLLKGMMNIGLRPTVDGSHRVIEVNLFDFDTDIYGLTIKVFLKKHLRSEQKFAGLEALKEQLAKDGLAARAALT